MAEFVPITDQRHAEPQTCERPKKANHSSLAKKNPDDLPDVCPEGFHDSDFPPLLDRHRDECAHDSERRDHHNKEQKEKHDCTLDPHSFEILMVHVYPRLR